MSLEETIQSMVNSVSEGAAARFLRALLFVGLSVCAFALYAAFQFRGLKEPAAMEYAQLARRMAEGRGFTTACVRPFDLWYLGRRGRPADALDRVPDLHNAPFYPWTLARLLRSDGAARTAPTGTIYEPERRRIVPFGIALSIASGALVYLLGLRLFNARIGLIAAAAFLLSHSVLAGSISGTERPLATFLVAAAGAAAAQAHYGRARRRPFASWFGALLVSVLCCTLAFLTHYALGAATLTVAVFLGGVSSRRRRLTALLFIAAVCALTAPWLIHQARTTGSPLGAVPYHALVGTTLYPGDSLDRAVAPVFGKTSATAAIKRKLVESLPHVLDGDLRVLGGGVMLCLFVASFFHPFERDEANWLRWAVALGMAVAAFFTALGRPHGAEILGAFLPFAAVYAAAMLFAALDRWEYLDPATHQAVTWLFVVLTALPAVTTAAARTPASAYPPYYAPFAAYVGELLEADEVLCTDIPWATAWYGNRTSLLLPAAPLQLTAGTEDAVAAPIAGVYLTQRTGDQRYTSDLKNGRDRAWLPVLNLQTPDGFRFTNGIALPPGTTDQLFLTDRVRWE